MSGGDRPVWLVTGASRGFGRAIVREALGRGFDVVAIARDAGAIRVDPDARGQMLPLALDVTDSAQITAVIGAALVGFGRIDVLVNNAGHGYLGAVEEGDEADVRSLFDVNFFGLAAMTRAVLPVMRGQGRGTIVNISSAAGFNALPASGYYAASKFAVEGLSEALVGEVAPLGLKVLIVEPGPFRTDWAGTSMRETRAPITAYAATAGARRALIRSRSGLQPGCPERAAAIIVDAALDEASPLRLPLGRSAYEAIEGKLSRVGSDIAPWRTRALAADRPPEDHEVAA